MHSILLVILLSMTPLVEARGALPYAFVSNVDGLVAFAVVFAFSSLPSLPIVYGLDYIESRVVRRNSLLTRVYEYALERARRKAEKISSFRVAYLGLALFVAVPLPGTGVWSASLISYVLGMNRKYSILSIVAGNLVACTIVYASVYAIGSAVFRN